MKGGVQRKREVALSFLLEKKGRGILPSTSTIKREKA